MGFTGGNSHVSRDKSPQEESMLAPPDADSLAESGISSETTLPRAHIVPCEDGTVRIVSRGTKHGTTTSRMDAASVYSMSQSAESDASTGARTDMQSATERTALLLPSHRPAKETRAFDVESQGSSHSEGPWPERNVYTNTLLTSSRKVLDWKSWSLLAIYKQLVVRPTSLLPAVSLGLLLNMLDALSYGMILFPLNHSIFKSLGPDGISIFYVSTIIAQIIYSSGGSGFRGGVGSEMIEIVPFFHKMALTILVRVGEARSESVLATTVLAYALSSIATGAVFFLMSIFRLGKWTAFFPQHVLIGCVGGVGWFLMSTAMRVCTGSQGKLTWDFLIKGHIAPLWLTPLGLAIALVFIQSRIKSSLLLGSYLAAITTIFYTVKFCIGISMASLRDQNWIFGVTAEDNSQWYHFYKLYNFRVIDWTALRDTVPTMLALVFFSVLHVPINIPALSVSTDEDDVDVNQELFAHGLSNCVSGLFGSVQNYLVYANSLLFMKSGGNDRLAGLMLAIATLLVLLTNLTVSIIGYVPIMVVGILIFLLGIELLAEALVFTFGQVHYVEYATILIVIIIIGVWDFTVGIAVGIVLAALHSLIPFSRRSVIQETLSGDEFQTTSKRSGLQLECLSVAKQQITVIKLSGILFFGTIPEVEYHVRSLVGGKQIDSQDWPLRYLILDMANVSRVDFSAAQVIRRISKFLRQHDVRYVISSLRMNDNVDSVLRRAGLLTCEPEVWLFESLEKALEACEDQLLTAL